MKPAPLPRIIVDTREPSAEHDRPDALFRPFILRDVIDPESGTKVKERAHLPIERRKLNVGDYSLDGLTHLIAIERKTPSDLLGTLYGSTTGSLGERLSNLDRFRREWERARDYHLRELVIEATEANIWNREFRSRVEPVNVLALLSSLCDDYGIRVTWRGAVDAMGWTARNHAEYEVGRHLARIHKQATDPSAAKEAATRGVPWAGLLIRPALAATG